MSFLHAWVIKAELTLTRYVVALDFLSTMLLAVTLFLPLTSSLIILVLSVLIQAVFFRIMHREKVGVTRLLKRLAFLVISAVAILAMLFRNHLL